MNKKFSIKQILDKIISLDGGVVFDHPYYLNIVGIRNENDPDKFNDTMIYFWFDETGNITTKECNHFTTDPGVSNMTNTINSKGCAIVKPGFYRKLWTIGKHQGKYKALVQYSPIKVYRDNNRDKIFDFNEKNVEEGMFGINLHRANENSVAQVVGPHSAGCAVFQYINDFNEFISHVDKAGKAGQKFFSYALFNEIDFI